MNGKNIFFAVLTMAMVLGCAKDKNVDDYKNSKVQRDLAKLEAVQAQYKDYLISKKTLRPLGALQITLKATTEVQTPNGDKAAATPILVANIEFLGKSRMAIIAQNSSYDPNNGHYQADILIPSATAGAPATKVSLSAVLAGGTMTGSIETLGFSDWGGTFELKQTTESLESLAAKLPDQGPDLGTTNFNGSTDFFSNLPGTPAEVRKPVELILLKPHTTSEEDFLDLISPIKSVLVTLNYGNGARILFQNGLWDQSRGTVTGQTAVSRSSANNPLSLNINCQSQDSAKEFDCDISTNAASAVAAKLKVRDDATQLPAESNDQSRNAIRKTYSGIAKTDTGNTYKVQLAMIYGARPRLDEILDLLFPVTEKSLQAGMVVNGQDLNLAFSDARWDVQNKTLSAIQKVTVGNGAYDITLECNHFSFADEKSHYDFTCTYLNTMRQGSITVHFKK